MYADTWSSVAKKNPFRWSRWASAGDTAKLLDAARVPRSPDGRTADRPVIIQAREPLLGGPVTTKPPMKMSAAITLMKGVAAQIEEAKRTVTSEQEAWRLASEAAARAEAERLASEAAARAGAATVPTWDEQQRKVVQMPLEQARIEWIDRDKARSAVQHEFAAEAQSLAKAEADAKASPTRGRQLADVLQDSLHQEQLAGGASEAALRSREVQLSISASQLAYYARGKEPPETEVEQVHELQNSFTKTWSADMVDAQFTNGELMTISYDMRVFEATRTVYVAFRGTDNEAGLLSRDWIDNFSVFAHNVSEETGIARAELHSGFRRRAQSCSLAGCIELLSRSTVDRLVVTGHSLGGATAQCLTLSLLYRKELSTEAKAKIHCVAFGMPFTVNTALAAEVLRGRHAHYFTCVAQREDPIPRILTFDGPILRKVVGAFKSGSKSEIPSTIARIGAKIVRRLPPVAVATLTQWAVKHVMIVALSVVKRLLDEETPVLGNRYTPIGWLYVLSFDTNYVEDYAFDFERALALLRSHRKGWLWRLLSQWSAYKERCLLVHSIDTGGGYNSVCDGGAGPSA